MKFDERTDEGQLFPAIEEIHPTPPKEHPIDRALAALSDAAIDLLATKKPSRFAEVQSLAGLAMQVHTLRPMSGVDDALGADGYDPFVPAIHPVAGYAHGYPHRVHHVPAFNDLADINRQLLMLAQNFVQQHADDATKRARRPDAELRLTEAGELAELILLRVKLLAAGEDVPKEVASRIEILLAHTGEAPHASTPENAVVPAEPLRRHPLDGPGERDGGRMGEALAERAGGANGAR
jgi:hypothetical protein